MFLTYVSALKDNYIWILYNEDNSCIIIDPGVSNIVIKKIIQKKLNIKAILLTHGEGENSPSHAGHVKWRP